jgi:predicted RNA-binding protein with PIN domain
MNYLLIDGYNLLACRDGSLNASRLSLEMRRKGLLDLLAAYVQVRPLRIRVVFDGTGGASRSPQRETYQGLEVVYSAAGATADDAIRQTLRQRDREWLVVSSDREVAAAARQLGLASVGSADFLARVEQGLFAGPAAEGRDETPEEARRESKKGPARRLKKSERKRARLLGKM